MNAVPVKSTLIDITKCIGCRACQVACKHQNDRDGEQTEFDGIFGLQNPITLSAKTLTLITFHELPNEESPGAALPSLPAARVRFGLSDDGLATPAGRNRKLRCGPMHRVPLLYVGMSLGSTYISMGHTHAQNSEVYKLRGPIRSAGSAEPQRTSAH
jgi:ferredoxin